MKYTIEQAVTHLKNGGAIENDNNNLSLLRKILGGSVMGTYPVWYFYDDGETACEPRGCFATSKPIIKLSGISQDETEEQQARDWYQTLDWENDIRPMIIRFGYVSFSGSNNIHVLRLYNDYLSETTPQQPESVDEAIKTLKEIGLFSQTAKAYEGSALWKIAERFSNWQYQQNELSPAKDNELVDDFQTSLELLRDLADLQNGAPLETYRKEWEETIEKVYRFLTKHEIE